MSNGEYVRWRDWYRANRHKAADASADPVDWAPGLVHAAAELLPGLRMLYRRLNPPKQTR
jgi:hypothetical protein